MAGSARARTHRRARIVRLVATARRRCLWSRPGRVVARLARRARARTRASGPARNPQEASAVNEEPNPSGKSRCSQLNKKGEPCKAWAMHDDPLGRCPAHAGVALKNLDPVRAQQVSAENRKRRVEARKLSVLDWTAK